MDRRQLLAAAGCGAMPFISGCLNDPGTDGGVLEVLQTTKPANATVIEPSDERIRNVEEVQEGLQQAASATNSAAEIEVTDSEYDTVTQALSDLPWYERSDHGTSAISGIYFKYEEAVYVVVLTPFCTDSWIKDAQSERGEYGWGGCYDRDEWGY